MAQRLVSPQEPREQLPEVLPALTFAELFDSHFAFVWRTARRLGVPDAQLDDVVQETFMVAYRRRDDFEAARPSRPGCTGSPSTWSAPIGASSAPSIRPR